jgi:hypothetical protein
MENRVGAARKEIQRRDQCDVDVAHVDAGEAGAAQRVGDFRRIELALVTAVVLVVARPEQQTAHETQNPVYARILRVEQRAWTHAVERRGEKVGQRGGGQVVQEGDADDGVEALVDVEIDHRQAAELDVAHTGARLSARAI